MNRKFVIGVGLFLACRYCPAQSLQPDVPGNWVMSYDDEFNSGVSTDLANWSSETGNGSGNGQPGAGWGNNEDEYYNAIGSSNVSVTGGDLNIIATSQTITSNGYTTHFTSARLKTPNVFDQTYGVIEFRAKLPAGNGLWPAVWMMPENSVYGGWPTSGEIDILESKGSQPNFAQGSLHSGPNGQDQTQTATYHPSGFNPTSGFHTYDLVWTNGSPGSIKWYVDGHLYETQTGGWYTPSSSKESPFNQPFYLIVNLATGGSYGGSDSGLTGGTLSLDYIRAFSNMLGDTNNDDVVNSSDLSVVINNFGKTISGGNTVGDFNGDGKVNADDLALLQLGSAEQNKVLGSATPEPAVASVLLLIPLLHRRRAS